MPRGNLRFFGPAGQSKFSGSVIALFDMSDPKQEEVHGISSVVEDTPHVIAGYGETAKRSGAKTTEVRNVSIEMNSYFVGLTDFVAGRAFRCYQ